MITTRPPHVGPHALHIHSSIFHSVLTTCPGPGFGSSHVNLVSQASFPQDYKVLESLKKYVIPPSFRIQEVSEPHKLSPFNMGELFSNVQNF